MRGEVGDEIGGAVFAGEIEQRRSGFALAQQLDEIARVAAGGGDIDEARLLRRLGAAAAHRIERQFARAKRAQDYRQSRRKRWRW